jgi:hypothetical protein
MRALMILAALAAVAGSARAQTPDDYANSAETGAARAIAESMPDLQYPWQLDWGAFGVYASRDIQWHLWPPGPTEGVTRRTGWMTVNGRSISVSVCGDDERVGALMLETSDIWLGDGDLKPELEALGLTVRELERRERHPLFEVDPREGWEWPDWVGKVSERPGYRLYRLEQPGHEPAFLTASYLCTPPGTRHATHCSMTWTVELRAGDELRREHCIPPAEPLSSIRPS